MIGVEDNNIEVHQKDHHRSIIHHRHMRLSAAIDHICSNYNDRQNQKSRVDFNFFSLLFFLSLSLSLGQNEVSEMIKLCPLFSFFLSLITIVYIYISCSFILCIYHCRLYLCEFHMEFFLSADDVLY